MTRAVFVAALLLAVQVNSLPVTSPTAKDDPKVMKCIVEVISDTVSKPNPLPISQECLEILQGGASERTEQQKKSSGFEDELSEALESQSNKNTERDLPEGVPNDETTNLFAELQTERSQMDNERDISKEDKSNSLEERETRAQEVDPEEAKENVVGFESNEVGETEELPWDDTVDNHIHDDLGDNGMHEQGHQEDEESAGREEADAFEEKKHISENSQEESHEEIEDTIQDHAENEEEDEEEVEEEEEEEEEERGTSEEEHAANEEDEDDQKEIENEDNKDSEKDDKSLEEREKYRSMKRGRHHSLEESKQPEDLSHARDTDRDEMEEESPRDLEDAKRWNKMDELAKQLSTTKRTEENESDEDPDRSMKLALWSRKDDVRNPEEETRSPQAPHSKEDTSEGSFPVALPEEKKDEEGSANRRTEEQELESLAAIEAELEKVAQRLHALRRG
ncbi:chromogranin-A isoform X2 [Sphaerodactylus townsendi]|uniref:chromogranin-A isoform X2 n=1 Tax=Sphaerodactylus townsendi TaxID=933632 RepID=UPI0020271A5D|nr:chromogranin-A isoform X2 [Sphaerodactylus townsendi]